jgi:hypothetical protein
VDVAASEAVARRVSPRRGTRSPGGSPRGLGRRAVGPRRARVRREWPGLRPPLYSACAGSMRLQSGRGILAPSWQNGSLILIP